MSGKNYKLLECIRKAEVDNFDRLYVKTFLK